MAKWYIGTPYMKYWMNVCVTCVFKAIKSCGYQPSKSFAPFCVVWLLVLNTKTVSILYLSILLVVSKCKLFTNTQDMNCHFKTSNVIVIFCNVNVISTFITFNLYLKLKQPNVKRVRVLLAFAVHVVAKTGILNSLQFGSQYVPWWIVIERMVLSAID